MNAARLHALFYAGGSALLTGLAGWFYLVGDYPRILLPALLAPLMVVAALLRLGQPETARLSAYLVLICCYLVVAAQLPELEASLPLWLGLPPLLTLVLLPLGPATLLNLSLAPIWLLLADSALSPQLVLSYLGLIAAAGLASWETLHRRALLQTTDPLDPECPALTAGALRDRLYSECERASAMGQRLGVLVIHLPQLEMAEEQFGPRARQALLTALCQTVARNSREYDQLGREQRASFWLILPDTTENGALLVRQRLEQALARTVLIDTGEVEVRLAVCHLRRGESPARFIQHLQALTQRLTQP